MKKDKKVWKAFWKNLWSTLSTSQDHNLIKLVAYFKARVFHTQATKNRHIKEFYKILKSEEAKYFDTEVNNCKWESESLDDASKRREILKHPFFSFCKYLITDTTPDLPWYKRFPSLPLSSAKPPQDQHYWRNKFEETILGSTYGFKLKMKKEAYLKKVYKKIEHLILPLTFSFNESVKLTLSQK